MSFVPIIWHANSTFIFGFIVDIFGIDRPGWALSEKVRHMTDKDFIIFDRSIVFLATLQNGLVVLLCLCNAVVDSLFLGF